MGNEIALPLNPSHEDSRFDSGRNKKIKRRRSNSLNSRALGKQKKGNGLHSSRYVSFIVKESSYVAVGVDEDGNKMINEYTILSTLGSGAFAKVKLCMNNTNEKPFAVKIINKSLLKSKIVSNGVNALDLARRECLILKKLHHPNIVKLIEVIDDPENNKMFFVMEFVENGPVWKSGSPPFEEEVARKYTIDIINGLNYLHRKNIIHRDIKPENLLLDHNNVVKLSDFGVSEILQEEDDDTINKYAGTPAFQSPESIEGGGFSGKAADIWAVGVTLFLFIFGELPFNGKNHQEIWNEIQNKELQLPYDIEEDMKDFLYRLLTKDANKRIKINEIRKHPWIDPEGKNEDEEEIPEPIKPQQEEKSAYTRVQQKLISLRNKQIKGKAAIASQTQYLTKEPKKDIQETEKDEEEYEYDDDENGDEEVDIFSFLKSTRVDPEELEEIRKSSRESNHFNIENESPKNDIKKKPQTTQLLSNLSPTFSNTDQDSNGSSGILSFFKGRLSSTNQSNDNVESIETKTKTKTKSIEQEIIDSHKMMFDDLTETIDDDSGDVDEMTDYYTYSVEDETHASGTQTPDNDVNLLLKRQSSMFVLTNDDEVIEDQLEWRQFLKYSPRGGQGSFNKRKRELMEINLNEKLGNHFLIDDQEMNQKKQSFQKSKPPLPPKAIKGKNGEIKPAPPTSPKPKIKTHSLFQPSTSSTTTTTTTTNTNTIRQETKEENNIFDLDQTRENLQILLSTKKFQESFAQIEDPKERQLEISKFLSGEISARTFQTKVVLNTLDRVSRQSMERREQQTKIESPKEEPKKKEKKKETEIEIDIENEDELDWRDFLKAKSPKRRSLTIPAGSRNSENDSDESKLSESPELSSTSQLQTPSSTHSLIKKIISPRPTKTKKKNENSIENEQMPPPSSKPVVATTHERIPSTDLTEKKKISPRNLATTDFFYKPTTPISNPMTKKNTSTDSLSSSEQSPLNSFFSIFKKKASIEDIDHKKSKKPEIEKTSLTDSSKKSDEEILSPGLSLKSTNTIRQSNPIQFTTNRATSMKISKEGSLSKVNSFSMLKTIAYDDEDSGSENSGEVEEFQGFKEPGTVAQE